MTTDDVTDPTRPADDDGQYGPEGYLPPRAAQRARKIILREQMGLGWPIAAVVAGLIILAITVPFVIGSSGPPGEPFTAVGPLSAIDPAGGEVLEVAGTTVLVVRGGGALRAYVDPPEGARWCPESRRIESPAGQVWTAQGRLIAGDGQSLQPAAITAYEGTVYVDPTGSTTPLPPRVDDQTPAC